MSCSHCYQLNQVLVLVTGTHETDCTAQHFVGTVAVNIAVHHRQPRSSVVCSHTTVLVANRHRHVVLPSLRINSLTTVWILSTNFDADQQSLEQLFACAEYESLKPLFLRIIFYMPATSAPVERIFSSSGIIMRPHRARMSDSLLETLMFLKCNSDI